MSRSLILAFTFGIIMLYPITLFAEAGQKFSVDGYSLHVNATKLSNRIVVTGSIKGGEDCKALKICCYLTDENNRTDTVVAVIKNYRYSQRFSLKKKASNSAGRRWTVSDVKIYK